MKAAMIWVVLAGNLMLGWSFTQLRFAGVPLSEAVLIICLLTTDIGAVAAEIGSVVTLTPILIWWVYCIGRALSGVPEYGLWALRDASQAIDSLFLIVGFAFARNIDNLERLIRWLPPLAGVSVAYGAIGIFFKQTIISYSPVVASPNGEIVPIFGVFNTVDLLLIWAAGYLIISSPSPDVGWRRTAVAAALASYAIVKFQYRTTYLQLGALFFMMAIFRRNAALKLLWLGPMLLVVVIGIETFDVKISGRLSQVSLSFLAEHLLAIIGVSDGSNAGAAAAASGVDQRVQWWSDLYGKLTADGVTLMTGLGYGFPLISFGNVAGIQVREPHSSFMSVFSRAGLIGLVSWIWMHVEIARSSVSTVGAVSSFDAPRKWRDVVLSLQMFLILVLTGTIGEDNLEKPFFAIPYYFFAGVTLAMAYWKNQLSKARMRDEKRRGSYPRKAAGPVGAAMADVDLEDSARS